MIDEFFWDTLLMHIESGQVVPIIGQSLLQVETVEGQMNLQRWLAGKLAADFRIPDTDLTAKSTVSDLLCHPQFPREKRKLAYSRIKLHLDQATFEPPQALRQLARIRPLNLFISTTCDSLMAHAIDTERYGGVARTQVVNYTYRDVRDLPPAEARTDQAIVYHLFGQAASVPYFAVTEADYLEFFNALFGERSRVPNLIELLDQRDLLFLGTGFADWMSRFLLRFAKRDPLTSQRDFNEVFADAATREDPRFVSFISNFSQQTLLYDEGGASEFVTELSRRWLEKHPDSASPFATGGSHAAAPVAASPGQDQHAVFISYASEDYAAAAALCQQLTAAGVTVWFDKKPDSTDNSLELGDDYTRKIERNIRSCALFVPVISRAVTTNKDRFFRYEWAVAINRLAYFTGLSRRYILPVIVDDTSPYATGVPDQFGLLHAARAPGGELAPRDCKSIVDAARGAETAGV